VDRISRRWSERRHLINAGASPTRRSALRDALLAVSLPFVELPPQATPMPGSRSATPPPWRLCGGCDLRLLAPPATASP